MDGNGSFPMQNAKCLKLGLDQNSGKGKSRICCLPDSILNHILSFLDIKEAIKTSVLSKRWEFLWTSIPKLKFKADFTESNEKMEEFLDFVGRVRLLHDSSNICIFSLTCHVPSTGPATRINSWICAAVKHNVQKMILRLKYDYSQRSFTLPRQLFACESLNKLELDLSLDLRLSYFVRLPNLKILTLSHVSFVDDNSVKQLFSGCPKLEMLDLIFCKWRNVSAVHVSASMLVDLKIHKSSVDEGPGCHFMISAPRLSDFVYAGALKNEYCISMTPALVNACVDVSGDHSEQRRAAYHAHKLLSPLLM